MHVCLVIASSFLLVHAQLDVCMLGELSPFSVHNLSLLHTCTVAYWSLFISISLGGFVTHVYTIMKALRSIYTCFTGQIYFLNMYLCHVRAISRKKPKVLIPNERESVFQQLESTGYRCSGKLVLSVLFLWNIHVSNDWFHNANLQIWAPVSLGVRLFSGTKKDLDMALQVQCNLMCVSVIKYIFVYIPMLMYSTLHN